MNGRHQGTGGEVVVDVVPLQVVALSQQGGQLGRGRVGLRRVEDRLESSRRVTALGQCQEAAGRRRVKLAEAVDQLQGNAASQVLQHKRVGAFLIKHF